MLRRCDSEMSSIKQGSNSFSKFVGEFSTILDRIAGFCMFSIMVLVVLNVLFRTIFNSSILGTYEYVGFLTAAVIGLSLANCAYTRSHIAVDYFMVRLPLKTQKVAEILITGIALIFWVLSAWHLGKYAYTLSLRGVVSPTTQTHFYYFIYLVAFGLLALGLVLLANLIEYLKRLVIR